MAGDDKLKALDAAIAKLEKDFGKGAVMKLGDAAANVSVETVPTGSLSLDIALGLGGVPKGRIIEIYGPESSGKTTLAIHAIAEAQKAGGIAAFIDAEHAFDRFYAAKLGVDVDNLWISQPDNGEQALQIADQLISSAAVDIVVVDSVAALTPKKEIEGDMGDNVVGLQARLMSQALRKLTSTISKTNTTCIFINQALTPKKEIEGDMGDNVVGLQARLMSQALRKLTSTISKTNTTCIFINQLREKIGVMFGNPETTTGGNALKFYASVRLDIRKATAIKDGDEVVGNLVRVKVVKNKVAPPFRKAEFDIMFGEGISRAGEVFGLAVANDIIEKSGSWYSYGGSKLGQGADAWTPKKEIEGDMGDNVVGLQARLMSQALRKLTSTISKTNTTCIFINQLREKIGVMFGNPETTTGGNALKFYASVRLDIRKATAIKDGDEVVGNLVRVKVVKNKVAPPFRKAEFDIMFGEGISRAGEVFGLAVANDIIEKSGSWYSYGGSKLGQGADACKALLKDNPELLDELEAKVREALAAKEQK